MGTTHPSLVPSRSIATVVRAAFPYFAILLSTAHSLQSIILSGFQSIPGDMGDARLVNAFLEHAFQAAKGTYPWLSPSQFFPATGTIAMSENLWGSAALYIPFRLAGLDIETSFQGWFVSISLLNGLAMMALLRDLKVHAYINGFCIFLAISSSAVGYKIAHPQLHALFPFIIALIFAGRFIRTANPINLSIALLASALQTACSIYLGFFSFLIIGIFSLFGCLIQTRAVLQIAAAHSRHAWIKSAITTLIAISITITLLVPYYNESQGAGTRTIEELAILAPRPVSWLTASPFSWAYSSQQYQTNQAPAGESTFFSSWVLTAACVFAFIRLPRLRRSVGRWESAAAATLLVLVAGCTTWIEPHGNFFLWMTDIVSPLRAIRAFGRIYIPMNVVAAALFGVMLVRFSTSSVWNWRGALATFFAAVATMECVALGQLSYSKHEAQLRSLEISSVHSQIGLKKPLLFAPGYSNQGFYMVHLDAWTSVLRSGGYCLNGYSGSSPKGYAEFIRTPTLDNGKRLVESLGLSLDDFAIVTEWPSEISMQFGARTYNVNGGITITSARNTLVLRPMETAMIDASLHSHLAEALPCDHLAIFASYRIYFSANQPVSDPSSLRTHVGTVEPHTVTSFQLKIHAPRTPGTYQVRLSMVHEGVAWWDDIGFAGDTIQLIVTDS